MKTYFLFFLLIFTASAFPQSTLLKLNEIMFYPSSGNNEFIELYNASTTESIDLDGYKIKYYSSSPDIIQDAGEGTILNPQSYAVLLEGDYDFISGIYNDLIPGDALIIKISDNSFGSTGMSNTSDRPIWLFSPAPAQERRQRLAGLHALRIADRGNLRQIGPARTCVRDPQLLLRGPAPRGMESMGGGGVARPGRSEVHRRHAPYLGGF